MDWNGGGIDNICQTIIYFIQIPQCGEVTSLHCDGLYHIGGTIQIFIMRHRDAITLQFSG